MKKKADKQKEAQSLHQEFERLRHLFLAGFEKLTVAQDFELRKTIRGAGGQYRVIKNNVVEKAAAGTPAERLMQNLRGMTSLAYTHDDPVALAKALTAYARNNPTFSFKSGMVEGRVIDVRTIEVLAEMPSREELLARLLYLIQAPAQRLASAINGVGRSLAVVLEQGVKENKFSA